MNTQMLIGIIVSGIIKPVALIFLVILLWFFLRKKSASLQHFVLSLGIFSLLIATLLAIGFADTRITIFPWFSQITAFPITWLNEICQWLVNYSSSRNLLILAAIYLLPACSLIFYLLLGVAGLWFQTRNAQVVQSQQLVNQLGVLCQLVDVQRSIKLIVSHDVDSPQTWGCFRPVIMLPRESLLWDEDKQLSLLIHELGHITRWDWLTTLVVKITCACFWFLLPIWWIARQIYQQAEIACDDYIFKLRDKHLVYAKNLLSIADGSEYVAESESLHMRGHSPVYQRIMALLDKRRPHHSVAMETAQYWIICSALMLTFFVSLQLTPLQEQLQKRTDYLLTVKWPSVPEEQSIFSDASVGVENFSWELLQQLKSTAIRHPHFDDDIEVTRIRVAKPKKQELQTDLSVALTSPDIPSIQIQGYLPVDLATPEYPTSALQKGIEGWVKVEFAIDANGAVIEPRVTAHSPSAIFDRAVLNALKKSRYRPQLLNGQPVIINGVTETFRFQLLTSDSQRRR